MLTEIEVKKYWKDFKGLSRNNKALVLTGIGLCFLVIGLIITMQLPDAIEPSYTPNQEYLISIRLFTTLCAGIFVLAGLTMYTFRVTCPHCQKKV